MTVDFDKTTLYKTLIWKAISVVLSFILSYLLLGSFTMASKYALTYLFVSAICYYIYELIWKKINKRRKRK
jgi:uncharacterized membrane protein